MFLLLALLLLIFVPWPWSLAAAIASLVLFVFEVAYWQRRMRHRKVQTGVEDLVGATGEVTSPLAPVGQIRVKGELWEARASSPIDPGAQVRVVAVHGLTLEGTPARRPLRRSGERCRDAGGRDPHCLPVGRLRRQRRERLREVRERRLLELQYMGFLN